MTASTNAALAPDAAASLDAQEAAFCEVQADLAVEPFRASMPERDVAWMREQLLESMRADLALRALVRAASPREVDQSADMFRRGVDDRR